jgi:hypothetical protein
MRLLFLKTKIAPGFSVVPVRNKQSSLTSKGILTNHSLYAINKVARRFVTIEMMRVVLVKMPYILGDIIDMAYITKEVSIIADAGVGV